MNDVKISDGFKNAIKMAAEGLMNEGKSKVDLKSPYSDFFVTLEKPESVDKIFQTYNSEELLGKGGEQKIFVVCI